MPERERGIERSCAAVVMERHRGHPPTSLNVTITTGTSGASIRYTTNNTTPTATVGTIYTGPVNNFGQFFDHFESSRLQDWLYDLQRGQRAF